MSLCGNRPRDVLNKSTITIVTTECLPQVQAHINRLLVAGVLIRNDSLSSNAVVRQSDNFSAQGVVLIRGTVRVENVGGKRNQGHAGGDLVGKECAETAGAIVPKDGSAVGGRSELED